MITIELTWLDWSLALLTAVIAGISKAGIKGIAIIIVTLLAIDLRLIPGVLVGLWLGIFLVKKIKDHHYRQMILVLTAVGALVILFR